MPGIFNQSFGGGVAIGGTLADKIQERRDRTRLQELADLARGGLGNADVANQVGSGLLALGQVGAGIRAQNVPYQREQQELQRQDQLQQRDFLNTLALNRFAETRRVNDARLDPTHPSNAANFTSPVQAIGPDGNPVFIQTNSAGQVQQVEGFTPNNPIKTINNGTEQIIVDSRTGGVISRTPINNRQEAFDKSVGTAEGKTTAEKVADFPRLASQADEMVRAIDGVLGDPALDSAVGNIQSRLPDLVAGQDVVDFRTRAAQLQGKAFLEAYQSLKGGGQITEIEGTKAENAIARLNQAQSATAYRAALKELREVVIAARDRAAKSASAPRLQSEQSSLQTGFSISRDPSVTPASGDATNLDDIEDILKKYD